VTATRSEYWAERRIHLVDIENMCRGFVTPTSARAFAEAYDTAGVLGWADHVVVGTSPASVVQTYSLPRGWRRVLGQSGPDGADIALADALPDGLLLTSFDGLVIASGDHYFCRVAIAASKAGLHVSLVTTKGTQVSRELSRLAEDHIVLPVRTTPRTLAGVVRASGRNTDHACDLTEPRGLPDVWLEEGLALRHKHRRAARRPLSRRAGRLRS
jgi:hypothetical protein